MRYVSGISRIIAVTSIILGRAKENQCDSTARGFSTGGITRQDTRVSYKDSVRSREPS